MSNLQRAFERGFTKRAAEHNASALLKSAEFSEAFNSIKENLYPDSGDSLVDVADRLEPQIAGKRNKSLHEILEFGKHMGVHGLAPGGVGAGIGALAGVASSNKGEKLKGFGKGALIGGATGFGSGVLNDAYHLGENTRSDFVDGIQEQQDRLSDKMRESSRDKQLTMMEQYDKNNKNIDALKRSFWYEYFMPPHIESKLR